ncbi:MAG: type II toxin-antitoxin system HicB family antitoxin [Thermoguttaceae bacterium]
MSIKCTITIHQEENWYVAKDLMSGVASQGKSIESAMENLEEAISLYYEDNAKLGRAEHLLGQ